ncbi:response regulator [Simiduia agarivorans]|uniref:Response regulator receiver protein n=1 Tax=Simiduia agarivorans (strain DSM 21679 / JCM 13881 / BCRC 17597 / SA1) TaxID=1117647 RepID=K4KUA5_SIMAS|nr:response regulator transcription factor [Simiduia agarivorans]AFU97547.1 response regulator receiver protein [Simiduia agarivorans SA1 = DSM 21679]
MREHTIIIADDHPLFRAALSQVISTDLPDAIVLEAEDVDALQQQVAQHPEAALVLLDLHMPGAQGFSSLIHLRACYPALPVMMVSADAAPDVLTRALRHGAAGFLPKSCSMEQISDAIRAALVGERWMPQDFEPVDIDTEGEQAVAHILATLTPQQFRVATLISQGLLNKQIAYEMSVTEATVKAHATEIYRKLGVSSRTQAVLALQQLEVRC